LLVFEIRQDRQIPQGRRKLHAERAKYFELVANGYGFLEAARIVGVNYRTTKRWRSGVWTSGTKKKAGTVAPIAVRPYRPSLSPRYLSEQDRVFIADRLLAKWSIRRIARELNRSPSTISREVRRNSHPGTGSYRPYAAQARADDRRPRPKPGKIALNAELRTYVQSKLDLRWSPEQIARTSAVSSLIGQRCAWPTRRSTLHSTSSVEVSCTVSFIGRCAPGGLAGSRAVRRNSVSPDIGTRWS
jgi:transposase